MLALISAQGRALLATLTATTACRHLRGVALQAAGACDGRRLEHRAGERIAKSSPSSRAKPVDPLHITLLRRASRDTDGVCDTSPLILATSMRSWWVGGQVACNGRRPSRCSPPRRGTRQAFILGAAARLARAWRR